MTIENAASPTAWEEFQQAVKSERELTQRALKEVTMMLAKSQAELSKLTQRNAAITVQLQQIQSQVETLPRSEIRNAYNQALDSQQRMLMMRAQLEKWPWPKPPESASGPTTARAASG
jgi:two-component system sensor histidine kinase DegS